MSVVVLGISCFYHDAAAAIVRDGEVIAAAQEERFSRVKHDPRFPRHAINYCLEESFIEASELDAVVFYDNPMLSFDRALKTLVSVAPRGKNQWLPVTQSFLGSKLAVDRYVRDTLKVDVPLLCTRHHLSHAASAFYPSPFDQAAVLTVDGVGEWATTSIVNGGADGLTVLKEIHFPHSLGLLYSAVTFFCGFKVNSGEYKLMGLAPYGEPTYADLIRDNLIATKPDGSFRLNMDYFGYLDSDSMISDRFCALLGGQPRKRDARITRREMDLAASVQEVVEEVMVGLARHAREITGQRKLCLAGGVALNCVANSVIADTGLFEDVWIQPAAGDAGGALGAALFASHEYFDVPRMQATNGRDHQKGTYLGPAYSSVEICSYLDRLNCPYTIMRDPDERAQFVAQELANGKIVGFFSGRMEFGPRALGARSILGDPRRSETQSVMNLKIKYRESFRPFAPTVLKERAGQYFELSLESPYMLLVSPVLENRRRPSPSPPDGVDGEDLLPIVRQERSDIPAVTHVDYSARVQTLDRRDNGDYYRVIEAFERETGVPVVVNTSFNVRGEPIVCSPKDAYRCFMGTEMDLLVMEDVVLQRKDQPSAGDAAWKDGFEPD